MFRRTLVSLGATALLGMSLAAPATADSDVTYQGVFSGEITYSVCTTAAPTSIAGGTWRVNVHDQKATARFVITVDGAPHVAFTAQMARIPSDTATFEASVITGAGPLDIRLVGEEFSYEIAPYDYTPWGGLKCDSVTYHGTLT